MENSLPGSKGSDCKDPDEGACLSCSRISPKGSDLSWVKPGRDEEGRAGARQTGPPGNHKDLGLNGKKVVDGGGVGCVCNF